MSGCVIINLIYIAPFKNRCFTSQVNAITHSTKKTNKKKINKTRHTERIWTQISTFPPTLPHPTPHCQQADGEVTKAIVLVPQVRSERMTESFQRQWRLQHGRMRAEVTQTVMKHGVTEMSLPLKAQNASCVCCATCFISMCIILESLQSK